jgi:hypothetical protein
VKRILAIAAFAALALLLPTCRSTRHTVARIVTPPPRPTEVFVPAESLPTSPESARPATPVPRTAPPIASPTPTAMPVVTAPPSREDRTPGLLYEQYVPTVVAATPSVSPLATRAASPRSTRPPRTPTPVATLKPGVYYEDEEGRPLPTATPKD